MPSERVLVTAPSRLHFGLTAFDRAIGRQFGGVGVMIEKPGIELAFFDGVAGHSYFTASGPLCERASVFAQSWSVHRQRPLPNCHIEVIVAAEQHAGLGVGTQLGLAVAAGLDAFCGILPAGPNDLALCTGRAQRSSVGTYGFTKGGLIVEPGKLANEPLAPLSHCIALPEQWRFVIIRPATEAGLAGPGEQKAFDRMAPVPLEVTNQLNREIDQHMVPAAIAGDFQDFSESVYRYGHRAGLCFAEIQGGAYRGAVLGRLVKTIRDYGVAGVGQSSWGPTLFAIAPDESHAHSLEEWLAENAADDVVRTLITTPNNTGSRIQVNC